MSVFRKLRARNRKRALSKAIAADASNRKQQQAANNSKIKKPDEKFGSRKNEFYRLLYIRELSLQIGHRELFHYFRTFGNLKRVGVHQPNGLYKNATILFESADSLKSALLANPHQLQDIHFNCYRAGTWHLRWPKIDRLIYDLHQQPVNQEHSAEKPIYERHMQTYLYPANFQQAPSSKIEQSDSATNRRLSLLPPASKTLLNYLCKEDKCQSKVEEAAPSLVKSSYELSLMTGMEKNFNFVRHSYTDFMNYQKHPGTYNKVDLHAQVELTAIEYAAKREVLCNRINFI